MAKNGFDKLLRKIRATDSVDRKPGSGRPRSMRTVGKIDALQDLVLSQENRPQNSSINSSDFKRNWNKSAYSGQIIHEDLKLKCLIKRHEQQLTKSNKDSRLDRCKKLLRKFPEVSVDFIWFTDEKVFTVASPMNSQNDRL